jgi:hypothetical protein
MNRVAAIGSRFADWNEPRMARIFTDNADNSHGIAVE